MPLHKWKVYAPVILILVQIIRATAGTSSFYERTLSLAHCLKTWLWLSMDDTLFDSLGLMAWYKDDIDIILDLEKIGNDFIDNCKNDDCAISYGNRFTKYDFKARGKYLSR